MEAVLNFMYHGEANVAQDDLDSFLHVAKELEVKGLTQINTRSNKTESENVTQNEAIVLRSEPKIEPHPPEQDISHCPKIKSPPHSLVGYQNSGLPVRNMSVQVQPVSVPVYQLGDTAGCGYLYAIPLPPGHQDSRAFWTEQGWIWK